MQISLLLLFITTNAHADELTLDAQQLFARSTTHNVRLSADGKSIELTDGVLIEDDGPAAGYSYLPNEERITDQVWVRKTLLIDRPQAKSATLLVGVGGQLKAIINGRPVELPAPVRVAGYWQAYAIPPDVLKAGANEIVLHGTGRVWIARAEDFASGSVDRSKHPRRSARSTDGGKNWEVDKLGPKGDIAGEYCIRLRLEQPAAEGRLTLPVMDVLNLTGRTVAPAGDAKNSVEASLTAEGGVRLERRSGPTPIIDEKWSGWLPVTKTVNERGRYFQLCTVLRGGRIASLTLKTPKPVGADWSAALKVTEYRNAPIVASSIRFAFEAYDHPKLKQLRSEFNLDEVVKGAKTEFQQIEKLAIWSSGRWQKGHLKDIYPAWDALEIMRPHADGTPIGGFCQHYNLVFLQACESFGIPGRAVSISVGDHGPASKGSGHEVVEIWSNEHAKWVYVDGNCAWYAVDAKLREPLSLRELRDRQRDFITKKDGPATEIIELAPEKYKWSSLSDWPAFQELRLIPRSNFLAEKAPLPLHQGMRGWFWTGHHVWSDAQAEASMIYSQRVTDPKNWDWTVNQVHIRLEATEMKDELRVHLETNMPGIESFMASIDAGPDTAVKTGFIWKLHQGNNELRVHARNIAGRKGSASNVTVLR